jgi:CRP-like cAMP-binding protein
MMASVAASTKTRECNPSTFLATIGQGRKSRTVAKIHRIFTQGDAADAVFYIQKGKVTLTDRHAGGRYSIM